MFAGAAFTDQADIKVENEVVDTLIELGVINGYTDGSFKPNDTVTRAEMAKMIYVLRTGNSDASAYNNDKTTFTDIKGHWAAGYIKYCQSLGIIAGVSATQFKPDTNVTAQEAAKMLLVTLGYDATKAGLVGINWASKTNALADENGLLDDVTTSFTGPCPRQYAAQLMYNAIDAATVVWRDDAYTNVTLLGTDNKTVGEKFMNLKKTQATLTSVVKTSGKDTYELTLDKSTVDVNESTDGKDALTSFTDVKNDYSSLKYKTVTVLHKDKKTVYGVYATSDNTVQSGVLKDLKFDSSKKIKLDDVKYDLADNTKVYVNGSDTVYTKGIAQFAKDYGDGSDFKAPYLKGTKVELLATDGTTKYSILNVTTYEIAKVTYVGSDYVNVSLENLDGRTITNSKTKLEEDDWDWYDGIKKDDYVVLTAAGNYASGDGLVEKADIVEGKVDSTKGSNKVQINNEWYTMAGKKVDGSAIKAPNLNAKVKLIVVNGFAYLTDTVTAGTDDIALLVEVGTKNGVGSKREARLIFADGSDKTVEIKKNWEDDSTKGEVKQDIKAHPQLVTFDVSKDVYTLTQIGQKNTEGYDVYAFSADTTGLKVDGSVKNDANKIDAYDSEGNSKTLNKLYFESTGIVFIRHKDGAAHDDPSFKVITGKAAADYDNKAIKYVQAVANESNKNYYAQVAVLDFGGVSTGGSTDNYLVALDDSYTSKIDGTTYTMVKAWNGTEEKLYKSEDKVTLKAGTVFQYSNDANDSISITELGTDDHRFQGDAYVANYDEGTGDITLYKDKNSNALTGVPTGINVSKVDSKDTVVFYVDSDAGKGVASGAIRLADIYDGGSDDNANVHVYAEDNDQITVLVVDVNNNITKW